jgi:putative phosphoesterase
VTIQSINLGIVSDTHGHLENTLNAVRMLQSFSVDVVIHCGDIGSVEIPELFANWRSHFVFGNVDRDEPDLRAAIERAGGRCHGRFGTLELSDLRIAFLHGDDSALLETTVASNDWDLVCYGHTHRAEHHMMNDTLVLNPGAIYRARPHSVTVVSLPTREVTRVDF